MLIVTIKFLSFFQIKGPTSPLDAAKICTLLL